MFGARKNHAFGSFRFSSKSGLKLKKDAAPSPSLCRTRTSRELNLFALKNIGYTQAGTEDPSGCVRRQLHLARIVEFVSENFHGNAG